jgi:nucleotide-binding universal stress UspA family protein
MYHIVLLPLDGSENAECTLNNVKNMAKEGSIEEIILFHDAQINFPLSAIYPDDIIIGYGPEFQAFRQDILDKSHNYLTNLESQFKSEGLNVKSVVEDGNSPAQDIVDYARKNGVELIVIATHGYTGLKKMLLGSVAFKVLHESPVPVLLIRPGACQV